MALNRNRIRALLCIAVSAATSIGLIVWAVRTFL
jgi:hypothetical protein